GDHERSGDHEERVAGVAVAAQIDVTRDRRDDGSVVGAEDDPHGAGDDQAHGVGPQQLDQVLPPVDAPEDKDFDDSPNGPGHGHGHEQSAPEAEAGADVVGDHN